MRTKPAWIVWSAWRILLVMACAFVVGTKALAESAVIEFLDGRYLAADWIGFTDERACRFRVEGEERALALDELAAVAFAREMATPTGPDLFYFAGGGRVYGRIIQSEPDGALVASPLGDEVSMSFGQMAGVRFGAGGAAEAGQPASPPGIGLLNGADVASALSRGNRGQDVRIMQVAGAVGPFESALAQRQAGADVLISRGDDDGAKSLSGRVVRLDADGGVFEFGGRQRSFSRDKVLGIVFAAAGGVGTHGASGSAIRATLIDGSVVVGQVQSPSGDTARLETGLGLAVDVPIARIARIDFPGDRIVYVSDLDPLHQRADGVLHRPWSVRMDASVAAGPITIGGRRFTKGIGCHSFTEIEYDLDGAFATFAATIGIDDRVRPLGSVVFRVVGDGQTLFDSGVVTGRDDPRELVVDVAGLRRLALVVDYADGLDLSDHADWGAARLIKKAGGKGQEAGE